MKVSKTLGCVLGLHVIIAILIVQPGCRSGQPPTQTYTQQRTTTGSSVPGAARTSGDLIPAVRVSEGRGLDSAFNAGFESSDDFSELDSVEPLEPISMTQTVDISGPSYETYTIKKGDNLWSLAKRFNVSLNELYAANGLNKNSVLRIGQQIKVPVEGSTATVISVTPDSYQPTGYNQESTSYTVKRGDNFSKIAKQFDTTVRVIKAANGRTNDMIRVGEVLIIPLSGTAATPSITSTLPKNTTSTSVTTTSNSRFHTVQAGEYPAKIAKQYGMTSSELLAMNGITDPRTLQIGQKLRLSESGRASNVDSRTETIIEQPEVVATPPATFNTSDIRVIEADPLVDGDLIEVETEDPFVGEDVVEIPVIRLEQ